MMVGLGPFAARNAKGGSSHSLHAHAAMIDVLKLTFGSWPEFSDLRCQDETKYIFPGNTSEPVQPLCHLMRDGHGVYPFALRRDPETEKIGLIPAGKYFGIVSGGDVTVGLSLAKQL